MLPFTRIAIIFGGAFTEETAKVFLEKLGVLSPEKERIELPDCCEIAIREKAGERYYFVLNYSKERVSIRIKERLRSIEDGASLYGEVSLEPYGVLVLKK